MVSEAIQLVIRASMVSSEVRASNWHLEGHWFDSRWEDSEFFLSIRLESAISLFSFTSKSPSDFTYHKLNTHAANE